MHGKDLVSMADLEPEQIREILRRAVAFKRGETAPVLAGKSAALILEKPSLRTRVSFELAIRQLGGFTVSLDQAEVGLGTREPVADVARVLSRYVDLIAARTHAHGTLVELARHATVPVLNLLSDREHPCQALADVLTVQEKLGKLEGAIVAYVGDGNNVAASLALACAALGVSFRIASPPSHQLSLGVASATQERAQRSGAAFQQMKDPQQAVRDAHVVYTDVWVSMGQEGEKAQRLKTFQGYQVTAALLEKARPGVLFMHPLPAHPGEEIEPGLLDLPASAVFDQAENRLHVQKAVLTYLLSPASREG
ncbi:MAG: ornithine carbamoyltransferase [Chloroflexi bacterium]|nr:ornithine carbamoyltransferase [Chloroflexota bacterium]